MAKRIALSVYIRSSLSALRSPLSAPRFALPAPRSALPAPRFTPAPRALRSALRPSLSLFHKTVIYVTFFNFPSFYFCVKQQAK